MSDKPTINQRRSFLQLLAKGRFAEAEMMMISSPNMRKVMLHLPALRHTRFFKERIRFYREYARKNGMVGKLRDTDRDTLRNQFAESHCKMTALSKACGKALHALDAEALQGRMAQIRRDRLRRKRQRFLGLF